MERAITECIQEGILADFLEKYRAEVKSVSIYEYNEERHMRQEEGRGTRRRTERRERSGKKADEPSASGAEKGRRMEEIEAAADPAYLEKLYREFGLLEKDEVSLEE